MNYYPEQLRAIADICDAISAHPGKHIRVSLGSAVIIYDPDDKTTAVGHIEDEDGTETWSFVPVQDGTP